MNEPQNGSRRNLRTRLEAIWRRYLVWQGAHMSQSMVIVLVGLLIGILTGVAAASLKTMIRWLGHALFHDVRLGSPNIGFLIWPLAGVLLTSIYQRYVVHGSVSRGTRIIRDDLDKGVGRLSPFMIFNPLVGCSLTIGFGASGGSEGPTALSGAAIGSNVGRLFGLSDSWLRLLVGIGGGAGISAIFKSPIGGVLFTLEVLQMPMTTLSVIALIIACLFSSTTAYLLSDFTFDIFFDRSIPFDPHLLGWLALLGFFCGLYSIYYNFTKSRSAGWFSSIRNPWVAALVTGGALSLGAFLFPVLFGEGFNTITGLVNGEKVSFDAAGAFAGHTGLVWLIICMAGVLLLKGILVAAAYSGGGVAGDFVPTFFAGGVAGYLFAVVAQTALGVSLPPWFFALAGMGAVMAGTIHAPLMSIFILCETTNTYGYIFPYLVVIIVSYATVKILTPHSWYDGTQTDDLMSLLDKKI